MYELSKKALLRALKVPPEPQDPLGAGESLLVFRAAPNYLKYKLFLWGAAELFVVLAVVEAVFTLADPAQKMEGCFASLFSALIGLVLVSALAQIPFSYVVVRLDYEMRWYKVTDKSLRIREGVLNVREMTMTFANIQNISISQGPLQRVLGIADLKVRSAGGGGAVHSQEKQGHQGLDMHTGYFRGVDNAEEIRDLMRERLRALRDAGLGDPDQVGVSEPPPPSHGETRGNVVTVLEELRAEARLFRQAAERLRVS